MRLFSLVAIVGCVAAAPAGAQATYKRTLPDSLVKQAKITEDVAAATVLKRVPKGAIEVVELEREDGKLLYSYDVKTPGKSGIDEVHVDALSGKIISFVHETPAMEKKEAAADAKTAAKKKKP